MNIHDTIEVLDGQVAENQAFTRDRFGRKHNLPAPADEKALA